MDGLEAFFVNLEGLQSVHPAPLLAQREQL